MSARILDRTIHRIQRQTQELEHEVGDEITADGGDLYELQSRVWMCVSIEVLWRGLVRAISNEADLNQFWPLTATLREAAWRTLQCCEATLHLAETKHLQGVSDLLLMKVEVENILTWLENWPEDTGNTPDAPQDSTLVFVKQTSSKMTRIAGSERLACRDVRSSTGDHASRFRR